MRALLVASLLLATPAFAQQQGPANFDVRLTAAMRNDLAVMLIKLQQSGLCDVPCHLVLARALVAIDTATPVAEKPTEPPP